MKEVMTATTLEKLNLFLNEHAEIKVTGKDIEYQEELFNKLATANPDVLIVADKLPGVLTKHELCEEIVKLDKKMKIIFILKEPDDAAFKKFLKGKGVDSYFDLYDTDVSELLSAIIYDENHIKEEAKQIIKESQGSQDEVQESNNNKNVEKVYLQKEVITIVSPGGGGTGKTTIAINFAVLLAEKLRNGKVVIVDFNDEKADIARSLSLPEDKGLEYLAKKIKEDEFSESNIIEGIQQYNVKIPNLYIMGGIKNFLNTDLFSLNHFYRIIEVLKKMYDYVIIDTGRFKSYATHAAIEKATKIIFVVRNTENSLSSLKEKIIFYKNDLGMDISEKANILMNMVIDYKELNEDAVIEIFKKSPVASISFNENIFLESEKYKPFVLNKKFKSEIKQIDNAIKDVINYKIIDEDRSFMNILRRKVYR